MSLLGILIHLISLKYNTQLSSNKYFYDQQTDWKLSKLLQGLLENTNLPPQTKYIKKLAVSTQGNLKKEAP